MKSPSIPEDRLKDQPGRLRSKNPNISGHRARMRDKVLTKSAASLTELELQEMLLYPSNPRGDTKPVAKRLMHQFQTLVGVLRALVEKLQEIEHVGPAAIVAIKVTEVAALHLSHSRIKNSPVFNN